MTSSASNNSPRSSNTGEQGSLAYKASRAQDRSLPKVAFRKDVLFENVCCMPSSSLSTSKPSRLLQRSLRKPAAESSTDDTSDDKSSLTSEIHKTCGRGFCFKDDSVNGEEEEEAVRRSRGNLGLEKNSPTSTEPRGEGLTHLLTPSGGRRLPRDVVNQSNAEAAAAVVSTVDFQVDSDVSRIKCRPEGVVGADLNVAARSDGIGRENDGLHHVELQKEHFTPEHSSPPPPPVVGPDTVEGNLRAPNAASTELPMTDASSSSSDAEHHPHPQQQQQQVRSSGDILWEFNGRRLSNVCRNLMIESVGQLDGETDPTAGAVAVANETHTGDEHTGSSRSGGGGGYSTEKSNRREFSTADAVPGGCPFSSDSKAADPTRPAPLDRSGRRTGASDTTPMKRETADEFAASSFRDKTAPDAFSTCGEPPLRFLSDSPHRNNPPILSETKTKKKKNGTVDTLPDVDANSAEFDSMGDKQNSAAAAIAADLCEERSSPGKLRNDSSGGAVKWSARRGRTLERVTYDSGLLLKDFIRPDQKKFSVAPSADFSIDTELAIWEPSDYAPDRHKSVPPAAEASLKLARDEEATAAASSSMLRSRQASVSPHRQRIAEQRRSKGSKGVEFLDSWHRRSPIGAKLGRRTLSKEWQILTLTTTEEITTLIRPSTTCKDDPQTEPSISAHDRISSNDASELSEASSSDISGATDILFHINSEGKSDTAESFLPSCCDDHIGSRIGDARTDISEDASVAAKKQSARNAADTLAVSSTRSDTIPSRIILPTDEVSNKENSLKCGRCRDEDSTTPIEVDELVKTSLDSASENQDGTLTQKLSYSRDESSSDLSKLSAEEFLDFSNNNGLPTSWRRSPIQRSDDGDPFNGHFNRLPTAEEAADSSVSRNESESLTEKIYSKTRSTELTEYKHKSGFAFGNAFDDDDDDDNLDALVYDDLTLHIAEESDNPAPSSFRATESSVEYIPTERVDDRVGRQPEDTVAAGASSGEGSCRPRAVASKQDATADAAPANRRRSDSSEVLPEKAFLESVFSSLGTIIFLLLAALIFHLFNSFVDHEL